MASPLVHIVDIDRPPDALFNATRDLGIVVRARLSNPLLRLRAAIRVRATHARVAVCWSKAACHVATSAGVDSVYYRPEAHEGDAPADVIPLCFGMRQALRMVGPVVASPIDVHGVQDARPHDGVFRWLIADDAGPRASLETSVWATTLLHVLMRRRGERHRLLPPPGDAPRLRQIRRFADQLGVPDLIEPTHGMTWSEAVGLADAAVLTQSGLCDPRPLAACASAGLPVACTADAADAAVLDPARTFIATTPASRHVARAMLQLRESPVRRVTAIVAREEVARARRDFLAAVMPTASTTDV